MASSIEIARFFLDNRFPVSQRGRYLYQDIQDLVFIADGYHMALFNEPLVDTDFYAFQHGPVQKDLYRTAKEVYTDAGGRAEGKFIEESVLSLPRGNFGTKTEELLYKVNSQISIKDSEHLRRLTHLKKSPWAVMWNRNPFEKIPDQLTRDYYLELQRISTKQRCDLKPIYRASSNVR